MFGAAKPYDRAEVFAAAEQARAKGNKKKAIAGYRQILEHEPDDAAVHAKLAPLIVDDEPREAWQSFEKAAKGHLERGFVDRALATYRHAADLMPFIPEAWEQVAALHQRRGRKADAVKVLLEGQQFFWKAPGQLEHAVRLIEQALALEPWHLEGTIALAQALKRRGDGAGAVARLDALLGQLTARPERKRVLRARLGVAFSFKHLWAWLRG